VVTDVLADWEGWGIFALSSTNAVYSWVNATNLGTGVVAGEAYYSGIPSYYLEPGLTGAKISNVDSYLSDSGYPGWGFNLTASTDVTVTGVTSGTYSGGGNVDRSTGITFTNVTSFDGWGIDLWGSNWTNISNYEMSAQAGYNDYISAVWYGNGWTTLDHATFTNYGLGVEAIHDLDDVYENVNVTNTYYGIETEAGAGGTFSNIVVDNSELGVYTDVSTGYTVTGFTVSNQSLYPGQIEEAEFWEAGGFVDYYGSSNTFTGIVAQYHSVGLIEVETSADTVRKVTASQGSIGVILAGAQYGSVSGVTATGVAPAVSPWPGISKFDFPTAAVDSEESQSVAISYVNATNYGAAVFDEYSTALTIGAVNATSDVYGVIFNDTYNSLVTGFGAYKDYQGALFEDDAEDNTITLSSFVDDTSFGVALVDDAYDNTVYNNNFIGNNGATSTYSPLHIQATSSTYNVFDICETGGTYYCESGLGNYWADWHTYGSNGYLAPYLVSGSVWDYFPIGPQETFAVTFTETGLAGGTNWSVTFNGVTESSTTSTIVFSATLGTYTYQLSGVDGYTLQSASSGSVALTGQPGAITVHYSSTGVPSVLDSLNSLFSITLLLLVIAILLGLLLLVYFLRGRKAKAAKASTSSPPTAWTPPAGAAGGAAAGGAAGAATGSSGGGSTWSEGDSTGGSGGSTGTPPPSS